jgi:hypothetical protein
MFSTPPLEHGIDRVFTHSAMHLLQGLDGGLHVGAKHCNSICGYIWQLNILARASIEQKIERYSSTRYCSGAPLDEVRAFE